MVGAVVAGAAVVGVGAESAGSGLRIVLSVTETDGGTTSPSSVVTAVVDRRVVVGGWAVVSVAGVAPVDGVRGAWVDGRDALVVGVAARVTGADCGATGSGSTTEDTLVSTDVAVVATAVVTTGSGMVVSAVAGSSSDRAGAG